MVRNERSATIVRRHEPLLVPAEAPSARLASTIAVVLSTYRSDNTDMVIDHELWLSCMSAVGESVRASSSEVFLEPKRRFLEQFRPRRRGPSGGSLDDYAMRIRADSDTDDWETILWEDDGTVLAAATCERWWMVGGPMPYHDSYTTSLFVPQSAVELLITALQAHVARAGGCIEAVLNAGSAA